MLNSYKLRTLGDKEKRYCTCSECNTTFQLATVEEIEERYGTKVEVTDEGAPKDYLFVTPDDEHISFTHTKGFTFDIFGHMCLCETCNVVIRVSDKNVSYRE